jgi:regulator of nonsense transcripts 3
MIIYIFATLIKGKFIFFQAGEVNCNFKIHLYSLGSFGFTRAYIYFKNYEDIFSFRDRFDNYVFVDSKSNEYPAIVEFAPYQRRLASMTADGEKNVKKDSKCNTIDQDSDYLKFVENFDKPSAAQLPTCEAMLEELEQKEKEKLGGDFSAPKVMTPLLEFLKKKRDDKRSSKDVSSFFLFFY